MKKQYKIISLDLQKNLIEFLDEVQFDAAKNNTTEDMHIINFCSWAIKELMDSYDGYLKDKPSDKMVKPPTQGIVTDDKSKGAAGGDLKVILLYAPWCGHSKNMLPDYEKIFVDLLLKYKGFAFLAEYVDAAASGLNETYTDTFNLLIPQQITLSFFTTTVFSF